MVIPVRDELWVSFSWGKQEEEEDESDAKVDIQIVMDSYEHSDSLLDCFTMSLNSSNLILSSVGLLEM